jgi:DNA-binding transcriptional regulator YiaG
MATKLNPLTTQLRSIMAKHKLTTRAVAELLGRSRQCVKRWSSEHTIIPEPMLELLKYKIADKK